MPNFFLGIDVGGTKSLAWIVDETGQLIGVGQGGSAIHQGDDYDITAEVLNHITEEAIRSAGIAKKQIVSSCFGMAGFDWPSQRQPHLDAITTLGLDGHITLVNDAFLVLHAASTHGWGIALVAGTGCNCIGQDQQGHVGRAVGEGFYMGEGAGATELVLRAKYAVAAAWTLSGPSTRLTDYFIEWTGAHNASDLIEGVATRRLRLKADAAPLVFQAAQASDTVAGEIVQWAAESLTRMVIGVARQLALTHSAFELVIGGSFFNAGPLLLDPLKVAIYKTMPEANFIHFKAKPVIGAIILAMQQAKLSHTSIADVRQCLLDIA